MPRRPKRARRDRGNFARTNRTHPRNITPAPMRGGIRV